MNWVEGLGLQTVPFSILNMAEVCLYQGKSWCRGEPLLEVLQNVSDVFLYLKKQPCCWSVTWAVLAGRFAASAAIHRTDQCLLKQG